MCRNCASTFDAPRLLIDRFGSVAEVGIFVMTSQGLTDVANPSELFMSSAVLSDGMEGSAVAIVMEGTR
jgi:DNA repair protein RadA/Sms